PLEDDIGIAAAIGSIGDYDYVDRRRALVTVTRFLGGVNNGVATLALGAAPDAAGTARLAHGVVSRGTSFRPNRGAASGDYGLASLDVELHPNVSGDFVAPGFGLRTHYEGAIGQLHWQRVELGLAARKYFGPVAFAVHADGGL